MSVADKPTSRRGLQVRLLRDGCAILDAEAEVVHVLNAAAGFVFLHCDGGHTSEEIAALLMDSVPALDSEAARRDVDQGLLTLSEKNLLQ